MGHDVQDIILEALLTAIIAMVATLWRTKPSTTQVANVAAKIREEMDATAKELRRDFEDKITTTVNTVVTADLAHDQLQIQAVNNKIEGLKEAIGKGHQELREDIQELRQLVINRNGHGPK